jgi:hypothetical protein
MEILDLDEDGNDVPFEYCDDKEFINFYKKHYDIEDVKQYEISPGQDERCRKFGRVLENAPEGFVVAELTDLPQPPKKLNERWTDE